MRHSPASLERLQAVLDRSAKGAGEHLRSTFGIPDKTLSAHQLVRYLDKPPSVALATVSERGEPRVAPEHPDSAALDELYPAAWWHSVREAGDGVYLRIEAERMFAWAQDPAQFPE